MDIFDAEILKFWTNMNKAGVRFLMVGGMATNIHGFQRFTGDLDIWLEDNLENRRKFRKALSDSQVGDFPFVEHMQFVPGWTEFRLNNGLPIDVMTSMKGLSDYSFDQCLSIATWADIAGCKVPFLHINQLIANKKAVNRPKDQIDVIELEKIKSLRDNLSES